MVFKDFICVFKVPCQTPFLILKMKSFQGIFLGFLSHTEGKNTFIMNIFSEGSSKVFKGCLSKLQ